MSIVVGIAGHARSGKSTVARALGDRTGWPVASFGDEVLAIALERGLPVGDPAIRRASLMTLGEELVTEHLVEFCSRVLLRGGWEAGRSLIVEGVRHAAVARTLQRLVSPTPFRLVLVEVRDAVRDQRLREDGAGGPLTRATMDAHSTEREVAGDVAGLTDVVVSGEGDPAAAVDPILAEVGPLARVPAPNPA